MIGSLMESDGCNDGSFGGSSFPVVPVIAAVVV